MRRRVVVAGKPLRLAFRAREGWLLQEGGWWLVMRRRVVVAGKPLQLAFRAREGWLLQDGA